MTAKRTRRERFVEEYPKDLNATQAAIRAGYSEKTAYSQGHRLLKDVEVAAQIARVEAERSERCQVDADYVLDLLREVADKCVGRSKVKVTRRGKDVEVRLFDPTGAARSGELLGKHLGMFVERVGNPDGTALLPGTVTVTIVKPGERRDP